VRRSRFMLEAYQKKGEVAGRGLLDNRNQAGIDDALVGGDQFEAVDAGGGNDGAIGGILQRSADCRQFDGDFQTQRNGLDRRVGAESFYKILKRNFPLGSALAQERKLKESDSADCKRLCSLLDLLQNSRLLATEFSG
jgi:hypothetical protein